MTLLLLVAGIVPSFAQAPDSLRLQAPDTLLKLPEPRPLTLPDSLIMQMPDSVRMNLPDSILFAAPDSLYAQGDTLFIQPKGSLDRPAFSAARDSVMEDLENNIVYYFGDVTAKYQDMELKADYMAYNTKLNVVFAKGVLDTITNQVSGRPEMTTGGKTYQMDEVYYNFVTRKAKIKNMATQQKDGKLVGEKLKMMPDQSINISGGKYTVCDAEHPHYYLKMTAAKVMTEPKQRTMFGPAYVVIADVPLPFLMLPFGFVPEKPDRASGILVPTYGEENARGLYLRDFGYSFVIGDYLDFAITGDIYSYGSWAVRASSRYKKRYAFDGSLSINYSNDITGERGTPEFTQSKNFGVTWSHSQDAKARPGTMFRASVNFSSPSNNRYNSTSVNESLQNQASSSISYSKTWSGASLSVNLLHNQNSRDSSYSFSLPNITFNVNRFYPFKRKNRVGKERFYEQISLSYGTTFQNKIAFKASEFAFNKDMLNRMQNGMQHTFQIGLPGFTLLKYFQFSPNINYGMNWYFSDQTRVYNPETDKVEIIKSDQFSKFGMSHTYSGGISMNTRIYGLFQFGRRSRLQAIRHMITPSMSFSYTPNLATKFNGFRTLTYTGQDGKEHTVEYNRFAGQLYSPPSGRQSAMLSFSVANNLEAKMLKKLDPMAEEPKNPKDKYEKVKLLDQLNISGSYNFLADSMRLSNFNVTASTTVFGKLGINANCSLDPYAINEKGVRINKLNVLKTGHLVRLTNASASLSYSINGGGKYKGNDGNGGDGKSGVQKSVGSEGSDYARIYYHPVTGEYIPGGWVYYLNPNIPWSLSFNYSYSYSRSYVYASEQLKTQHNHVQTLGMSAQVRLTKAMNFSINTGFDLTKMQLSTTQISATYDLHCFAISVSWVPTGQWESWSFRIAAKASALSDLLQFKKSASYWDK
ncbi:MAG: LPS-assembly protein LptD [Bacteroidales bacterium]|nr:LPS-assembly protein LptD [Bacteroidales bacterium]